MRYRTRSDANQKEIDAALKAAGASVVALANASKGCPDRLVGYRGHSYLLETKSQEQMKHSSKALQKRLMRTPAQEKFHAEWRGGPIAIVFTVDEALKAIGAI